MTVCVVFVVWLCGPPQVLNNVANKRAVSKNAVRSVMNQTDPHRAAEVTGPVVGGGSGGALLGPAPFTPSAGLAATLLSSPAGRSALLPAPVPGLLPNPASKASSEDLLKVFQMIGGRGCMGGVGLHSGTGAGGPPRTHTRTQSPCNRHLTLAAVCQSAVPSTWWPHATPLCSRVPRVPLLHPRWCRPGPLRWLAAPRVHSSAPWWGWGRGWGWPAALCPRALRPRPCGGAGHAWWSRRQRRCWWCCGA